MGETTSSALVTGASGFLGRVLCQRLKALGKRVIAAGRHASEGPWDEFREMDLTADSLPAGLLDGIDTVYHLASKAHAVTETVAEADTYRPIIVEGTRKLLQQASGSGVKRFIYVSSVKAMGEGNPAGLPVEQMDETWPHTPQTPYGIAKAEAENLVLESPLAHKVVLRPVMVYGPGEKGNLPRMVQAVKRGRFPPLPETGNKRSMIHVEDLVEYMIRAGLRPVADGKSYILSGTDALSTRELYDSIREALGMSPVDWSIPFIALKICAGMGSVLGFVFRRRMPLDIETLSKLTGSAWYSPDLAMNELDYTPQHSVRDWLGSRD
jgi:nucleoside-diphosphate-sugar epimerase